MFQPNPKSQNKRSTRELSTQLEFRSYNKLELNLRASKNSCSIQSVEQKPESVQFFRTRQINSTQLVERKIYVQPCSTLELNARARVQLNSTITSDFILINHFSLLCSSSSEFLQVIKHKMTSAFVLFINRRDYDELSFSSSLSSLSSFQKKNYFE
jgi:hypothetical protein